MKRTLDDCILPVKHFHGDVTCLFDLPNEILLMICRYLSIYDIFHCFYTPDKPEYRLHCLINDYYTKINIDGINSYELNYLIKLFNDCDYPLRPTSLTLSNSNVSNLIKNYFKLIDKKYIQSIFNHLISFNLLNCFSRDLFSIDKYCQYLTKLEYLHLIIRNNDKKEIYHFNRRFDIFLHQNLFNNRLSTLHTIHIQSFDGLSLHKCLIPHENLRYVNINLHTIDDLYLLLNGLIPNIQILIVQLDQTRILKSHPLFSKYLCSKLIDFTLLDNSTQLVIDHIQSVLNFMTNLNKLTLSIRDTLDPLFCHGPNFETILTESLPNLRKFNYTMTHRITENTIIEDFIRWPMNFTNYENNQWIHIYSLPWPSSRDDQRKVPMINGKSTIPVTADVIIRRNSCLTISSSIEIKFSERITRLILNQETPVGSINSIVQTSIRHLIIKRRLIDENEICIIHHQYPNVKYLELLFPLKSETFLCCFKILFNIDDQNGQRYHWNKLIQFRTMHTYDQLMLGNDERFHYWLISNTDLKFHLNSFVVNVFDLILSIWL